LAVEVEAMLMVDAALCVVVEIVNDEESEESNESVKRFVIVGES
jgi:hypothetical protein